MAIDLKKLNKNQLDDLKRKIDARQDEIRSTSIATVRAKVHELIKSEGFTVEEILGGRGKRGAAKRTKVAPKYRDPADANTTWSGRGKRPRWFLAALKAGKKEKDLLIK
ncbi:MAG TPA: H-NS histone family protein [Rhodanobacteraceae bacterium]|nr:H-NS histone family protein [Rhodanobacteraceae bacterium]